MIAHTDNPFAKKAVAQCKTLIVLWMTQIRPHLRQDCCQGGKLCARK